MGSADESYWWVGSTDERAAGGWGLKLRELLVGGVHRRVLLMGGGHR